MISVIIPIYNAAKYLSHTFQCLRGQTYANFEVLLINDGSTDRSGELCEEIVRQDPRFRYFPQQNSGVSAARNHGIEAAQGKYITFIDADDEIAPNYLEVLRNALEESNCQMSVCDVTVITDGRETNRFSCPDGVLPQQEALNLLLSRRNINSGPCAKLFLRDILKDISFPPLKAYEDILFVTEAMGRCSGIAVTSKTEYRYIQNSSGTMGIFLKMPSSDIISATDRLLGFLQTRDDLSPLCFYITVSHLMQYIHPLLNTDNDQSKAFIAQSQALYRKYLSGILRCTAFPWKEKVLFSLFAFGWSFHERKIRKLR